VKRLLLSLTALILILTFTFDSAVADSQHVASTLVYRESNQDTVSILVKGFDNIKPEQTRSLSGFGTVSTVAGQIAVLHTQREELPSIARLQFVSRIEQSWPLHAYLDKSVPDIGANAVWNQVRDSENRNVTGLGVILGFVDTGIDISHPDFTFPNGTTKILYVWDQTTPGRSPPSFNYGYECDSFDIKNRTCPESDIFGHGTHVSGIATSSGQATGRYVGVAPDAGIIFVKSGRETCGGAGWTFDSAEILDGVNYIITKAKQLGRRVVINLSLGGNIGGHDGSDPMEIALDQFVEAGTPIVVAAGNQERDNAHIQGRLASDANVTFDIAVAATTTGLAIDIWYSQIDEVDATLTMPNGETYTVPQSASTDQVNVTTTGTSTNHGNELYFEVNSENPLATSGWRVTLSPRSVNSGGAWDAWVDTTSCTYPGAYFLPGKGYSIDPNDTIGIPGTAHYVVTVGAYVTKTSWKGENGETFGSNSTTIGSIASYSSSGPTRDGRMKPDVVAPGSVIASARSEMIAEGPSDPDPFHRMLAGTSMAAPHVAGTIALMLQYSPKLQAVDISRLIRETARLDTQTGLLPSASPTWGYGKIDARTATRLYRLTLIINGLPPASHALVGLDDKELEVKENVWLYVYFAQGTTHALRVNTLITTNESTRYQLSDAEVLLGSKTIMLASNLDSTAGLLTGINRTTILLLSYKPITPSASLILVLPSVVLLVLSIGVVTLCFELYLERRRSHLKLSHQ
jgi:subtilisin family serine protease